MPKKNRAFRFETKVHIVYRYDWDVPNRHFRYLFFKNGGTINQFKKLQPTKAVRVKPTTTFVYTNGKKYLMTGTGDMIRISKPGRGNSATKKQKEESSKMIRHETGKGPVYIPPFKRNMQFRVAVQRGKDIDDGRLVPVARGSWQNQLENYKYVGNVSEGYLNVLGGRVLPLKHQSKYWYFLRKRGNFVFSEHHPYGDEALCFIDPNTG
jgi:hypothetical protein